MDWTAFNDLMDNVENAVSSVTGVVNNVAGTVAAVGNVAGQVGNMTQQYGQGVQSGQQGNAYHNPTQSFDYGKIVLPVLLGVGGIFLLTKIL